MSFNLTPQSVLSNISLAAGFITKTAKVDVIQVLDQESSKQVFGGARPVKAEVRETARVMDYPVESGSILSDHRVSMPTEIVLSCIIPEGQYASTYPAIRSAWSRATLLLVQTRLGTYRNMIIAELPHDEDPDMYTAVAIFIKLREVLISGSGSMANFIPANAAYASTVNSGFLSAATAATGALSYLHTATVFGGRL